MKVLITVMILFLMGMNQTVRSQKISSSKEYLKRAEEMYKNIWNRYRVNKYGLFSENFPPGEHDSLTYLQGGNVNEKEVSFLWPFSGMFSATNVLLQIPAVRNKYLVYLDSLSDGYETYRDTVRKPAGYQAYPVMFEISDRYYDDNGLVAIDYAEAFLNTGRQFYLEKAKEIFAFILSGWNEDVGGGVTWLEGHFDQKPACSNGMATLSALHLYKATNDTFYLNWGKRFYTWMHDNLRDSAGVYWNDKKLDGKINYTKWTYNSGSMLESAVLLYQFTQDLNYLKEAQVVAAATFKYFTEQNRRPNLQLHIDLPWFVTVLFRGYERLYHMDGNATYILAIVRSLDYAWKNSRDKYGLVTHSWTPDEKELAKSKWLLDQACIAELYARISKLEIRKRK